MKPHIWYCTTNSLWFCMTRPKISNEQHCWGNTPKEAYERYEKLKRGGSER